MGKPRKIIALVISFCLIFEQTGFAQVAGQLDISGLVSGLASSLVQEKFRPLHLRYLSYDSLQNNFQLLLDKGDTQETKGETLESSAKTLLGFFFVGLALPNEDFWVNLRPDSPNDIINDELAKTDVGKILLEADLQLKRDTASYTSPKTREGKEYWDKLYQRAASIYGSDNVTIPTLTRPWIVPDEIIVREAQGSAYIYKATLKVMLEQDYLKGSATYNFQDERLKQLNEYSSELIRQSIIPKIIREINSAKRYAPLRQVYYSLILAQWFKEKYRSQVTSHKSQVDSSYVRRIDSRDLAELISRIPWSKDAYFKAYQKSFKDGEYNIKEPTNSSYGQMIRSYFSGGINFGAGNAGDADGGITQGVKGMAQIIKDNIITTHNLLDKVADKLHFVIQAESNVRGIKILNSPTQYPQGSVRLPGGIFTTPLSAEQVRKLQNNDVVSRTGSRLEVKNEKNWVITSSSLARINSDLGRVLTEGNLLDSIAKKASQQTKPLVIIDWGCGDATALGELADGLKQRGIQNVRLVGFGNMYFENWDKVARKGVDLVLDDSEYISEYFKPGEVDTIYSFWGLNHLSSPPGSNEEKITYMVDYLNKLHGLLAPEGRIVMTTYIENVGFQDIASRLSKEGLFDVRRSRQLEEFDMDTYGDVALLTKKSLVGRTDVNTIPKPGNRPSQATIQEWKDTNPVFPIDSGSLPNFKRWIFRFGTEFGSRWNWSANAEVRTDIPGYPHPAIDIFEYEDNNGDIKILADKTPLQAVIDGTVIIRSSEDLVIRSGDKYVLYEHIMPNVQVGQQVRKGIDTVGFFSYAAAEPAHYIPHLHLQVLEYKGDFLQEVAKYPSANVFLRIGQQHSFNPLLLWDNLARRVEVPETTERANVAPAKTVEDFLREAKQKNLVIELGRGGINQKIFPQAGGLALRQIADLIRVAVAGDNAALNQLRALANDNPELFWSQVDILGQTLQDPAYNGKIKTLLDGGMATTDIIARLARTRTLLAAYRIENGVVKEIFNTNRDNPLGIEYLLPTTAQIPGFMRSGVPPIPRLGRSGERSDIPATIITNTAKDLILLVHADHALQAQIQLNSAEQLAIGRAAAQKDGGVAQEDIANTKMAALIEALSGADPAIPAQKVENFGIIFENLPQLAQRIAQGYRQLAKEYAVDVGKIEVFLVGGRARGEPLRESSDIDMILAVENFDGRFGLNEENYWKETGSILFKALQGFNLPVRIGQKYSRRLGQEFAFAQRLNQYYDGLHTEFSDYIWLDLQSIGRQLEAENRRTIEAGAGIPLAISDRGSESMLQRDGGEVRLSDAQNNIMQAFYYGMARMDRQARQGDKKFELNEQNLESLDQLLKQSTTDYEQWRDGLQKLKLFMDSDNPALKQKALGTLSSILEDSLKPARKSLLVEMFWDKEKSDIPDSLKEIAPEAQAIIRQWRRAYDDEITRGVQELEAQNLLDGGRLTFSQDSIPYVRVLIENTLGRLSQEELQHLYGAVVQGAPLQNGFVKINLKINMSKSGLGEILEDYPLVDMDLEKSKLYVYAVGSKDTYEEEADIALNFDAGYTLGNIKLKTGENLKDFLIRRAAMYSQQMPVKLDNVRQAATNFDDKTLELEVSGAIIQGAKGYAVSVAPLDAVCTIKGYGHLEGLGLSWQTRRRLAQEGQVVDGYWHKHPGGEEGLLISPGDILWLLEEYRQDPTRNHETIFVNENGKLMARKYYFKDTIDRTQFNLNRLEPNRVRDNERREKKIDFEGRQKLISKFFDTATFEVSLDGGNRQSTVAEFDMLYAELYAYFSFGSVYVTTEPSDPQRPTRLAGLVMGVTADKIRGSQKRLVALTVGKDAQEKISLDNTKFLLECAAAGWQLYEDKDNQRAPAQNMQDILKAVDQDFLDRSVVGLKYGGREYVFSAEQNRFILKPDGFLKKLVETGESVQTELPQMQDGGKINNKFDEQKFEDIFQKSKEAFGNKQSVDLTTEEIRIFMPALELSRNTEDERSFATKSKLMLVLLSLSDEQKSEKGILMQWAGIWKMPYGMRNKDMIRSLKEAIALSNRMRPKISYSFKKIDQEVSEPKESKPVRIGKAIKARVIEELVKKGRESERNNDIEIIKGVLSCIESRYIDVKAPGTQDPVLKRQKAENMESLRKTLNSEPNATVITEKELDRTLRALIDPSWDVQKILVVIYEHNYDFEDLTPKMIEDRTAINNVNLLFNPAILGDLNILHLRLGKRIRISGLNQELFKTMFPGIDAYVQRWQSEVLSDDRQSRKDGGARKEINTAESIRSRQELKTIIPKIVQYINDLASPEEYVLYLDVDNSIWFLNGIVFPSNRFTPVRLSINPQISPENLADQCKYFLEKADEAGMVELVPGIEDILNAAKAKGIDVVVLSNRPERLRDLTAKTLNTKLQEAGLDVPQTLVLLGAEGSKVDFISQDIKARNKGKAILIDDQAKNTETNGILKSFVLPTAPWTFTYNDYRGEIDNMLALADLTDSAQKAELEVLLMSALLSNAELQGNEQRENLNNLLGLGSTSPIVESLLEKEYLRQFASELTNKAKLDGGNIIDISGMLRKEDKGGIDLRSLPIVTQPANVSAAPAVTGQPALVIANLDAEWRQIEGMVAAKMIPSSQRIKEFLVACCAKGELSRHMDDVLACIADILRMEEEKAVQTEPALKDVLILLESDMPARDLQSSLSRIAVVASL